MTMRSGTIADWCVGFLIGPCIGRKLSTPEEVEGFEGAGQSRQDKARIYNRLKRRVRVLNLGLGGGLLAVLLFTGLSVWLRERLEPVSANPWVLVFLYFVIFMVAAEILSLPLSFYGGYKLEHRYGLSRESLPSFYMDELKGFALNMGLGLGAVELIYWLLRSLPDSWWLAAAGAFIGIFVLMANLAPVLLFPIFFKFEPLEDEDLARRITLLAEKARTRIRGVFRMNLSRKTSAANAALAGLGNTRRIILADTLLDNFTREEIETVVAHELGHHVFRHIPMLIVLQSCFTVLALSVAHRVISWGAGYLGLKGIGDVAGLPLLVLSLAAVSLALLPLVNFYSRKLERDSDRYALEATGDPPAFISAMRRLASLNLAEMDPHPLVEFFFYGHPSISKRIGMAEEFAGKDESAAQP